MRPVRKLAAFGVYTAVLCAAFAVPLVRLVRLSLDSSLYSYILVIPFVSGYLAWSRRREAGGGGGGAGLPLLLFGALAVAGGALWARDAAGGAEGGATALSGAVAVFVSLWLAGWVAFWGGERFRVHLFPLLFLYAIVPFPRAVEHGINLFLQRASADATQILLALSGTPFLREGMVFQLPGLAVEVAEECSGIRSSIVLLFTAMMAGFLFLRTPAGRIALAASVVPIAVLRNATRIVTIVLLTLHVDPTAIHGPLHRRGGPLFFVFSLVLLLAVLGALRALERRFGRAGGMRAGEGGVRT